LVNIQQISNNRNGVALNLGNNRLLTLPWLFCDT
jgi:hypothetical protein